MTAGFDAHLTKPVDPDERRRALVCESREGAARQPTFSHFYEGAKQ